jgi:hypothetical protein
MRRAIHAVCFIALLIALGVGAMLRQSTSAPKRARAKPMDGSSLETLARSVRAEAAVLSLEAEQALATPADAKSRTKTVRKQLEDLATFRLAREEAIGRARGACGTEVGRAVSTELARLAPGLEERVKSLEKRFDSSHGRTRPAVEPTCLLILLLPEGDTLAEEIAELVARIDKRLSELGDDSADETFEDLADLESDVVDRLKNMATHFGVSLETVLTQFAQSAMPLVAKLDALAPTLPAGANVARAVEQVKALLQGKLAGVTKISIAPGAPTRN